MKKQKPPKFRPHKVANEGYIAAMRELRRSGASGVHADRRKRRARTRLAQRTQAISNGE